MKTFCPHPNYGDLLEQKGAITAIIVKCCPTTSEAGRQPIAASIWAELRVLSRAPFRLSRFRRVLAETLVWCTVTDRQADFKHYLQITKAGRAVPLTDRWKILIMVLNLRNNCLHITVTFINSLIPSCVPSVLVVCSEFKPPPWRLRSSPGRGADRKGGAAAAAALSVERRTARPAQSCHYNTEFSVLLTKPRNFVSILLQTL